jgi:TRAP-type C4-dicarboxylate transport system permease small subunit
VFCWGGGLLIAAILFNAIMRYGFDQGLIFFEETQWHLYAIGAFVGNVVTRSGIW